MKSRLGKAFVLAATALCTMAIAPALSSADSPTTIGQLAPGLSPTAGCSAGPVDQVQSAGAGGTDYVVPFDGTITQWSTNAAAGAGQMYSMKVFRHVSGTTYTVVGHDLESLTPSVINTFNVSIPVHAGDLLGNNDQNASTVPNACQFSTALTGDTLQQALPPSDAADNTSANLSNGPVTGLRLNVSAIVTPPATPASNPPGNPTSPINPAGHLRKRKCKKAKRHSASAAKKKKCKKRKRT